MAERKRVKVPHPLLAPWVRAEKGRMTQLVNACPATWAAVHNVVWYGTVPGYRIAQAMADVTGHSVEAIIEGCESAAEKRRELLEAAA